MDYIVVKEVLERFARLDMAEADIEDVTTCRVCNCLDCGGLTASRVAVHNNTECVGNALVIVPITAIHKEIDTACEVIHLGEVDVVEAAIGLEFALFECTEPVGRRERITAIIDICDLVEVVGLGSELVLLLLLIDFNGTIDEPVDVGDVVVERGEAVGEDVFLLCGDQFEPNIGVDLNGPCEVGDELLACKRQGFCRRQGAHVCEDGLNAGICGLCVAIEGRCCRGRALEIDERLGGAGCYSGE